jgi:hypothetical protein
MSASSITSTTLNPSEPMNVATSLSYKPDVNTLTAGTFNGALTGNATSATTATTAGSATLIATTGTTTNAASFYIAFVAASASATESVYKNASLYYNPSTNTLTVLNGTFAGTASQSSKVAITARATNTVAHYLTFAGNSATSTAETIYVDAGLSYIPTSGVLTAGGFSGPLTGTASIASQLATSEQNVSPNTFYLTFVPSNITAANEIINKSSALTYIPLTGILSATIFSGALSGNATTATTATNLAGGLVGSIPYQTAAGSTTLLASGATGSVLTSNGSGAPTWNTTVSQATNATNATNLTITTATTGTYYPIFASALTGTLSQRAIGTLSFNAANGTLSATTFSGAFSGNATTATTATNLAGGLVGSIPYQTAAGSTTLLASGATGSVLTSNGSGAPTWNTTVSQATNATNATNLTITTATTGTYYPIFASALTGTLSQRAIGTLSFNAANGTLSATTFSGAFSGNATTATTATNLAGGLVGSIPYQTAAGSTTLLASGATGSVLTSNGSGAPTWSTTVSQATTSTNLAGGSIGSIPYQTAAGSTTQLASGATGAVLTSQGVGIAPTWSLPRGYTVPFGSSSMLEGYLYANMGAYSTNNTTSGSTGASSRFVVPVAGTINIMTVAYDVASGVAASISIVKSTWNSSTKVTSIIATYTVPTGQFNSEGGGVKLFNTSSLLTSPTTALGTSIPVAALDIIQVKTVNVGFGDTNVVLYFA